MRLIRWHDRPCRGWLTEVIREGGRPVAVRCLCGRTSKRLPDVLRGDGGPGVVSSLGRRVFGRLKRTEEPQE